MKKIQAVSDYIDGCPDSQVEILHSLRELIAKQVPDAIEQFKWSRPVYGRQKDFCYLVSNKNYATLGFNYASRIEDPGQLLEGTGKNMRHIKLRNAQDLDLKILGKMIQQASKED